MLWKFTDDRPVYLQIMALIQGAVLKGTFVPGQRLPSVRELAAQAKVNPNTMQHALQELEGSGLLVTQGTSGRFVTEDRAHIQQAREAALDGLARQVLAQFSDYGLSPGETAALLQQYEGKDDSHG